MFIHRGEKLILFIVVQQDIGVFLETRSPGVWLHDGLIDHCGLENVDFDSELVLSRGDEASCEFWANKQIVLAFDKLSVGAGVHSLLVILVYQPYDAALRILAGIPLPCTYSC